MVVSNRSDERQSFELVYGQGGYCRALVRTRNQLRGGSLCKIVSTSVGYVAVPAGAQTPEYFVGYVPVTIPAETLIEMQVGGLIGPMQMFDGLEARLWLSFDGGEQIQMRSGEFLFPHEFGQVVSVTDDMVTLMLFPRAVKEIL